MKKVRLFFAAAIMVLMTSLVLATRETSVVGDLYACNDGINYYKLTQSQSLVGFLGGTGMQCTITDSDFGISYGLYYYSGAYRKADSFGW